MEMPGDLVLFLCEGIPYIYKDYNLQYKMKCSLAKTKKLIHTTHLQLMWLLQLAITSLTSLFAALIAVDGTL